MNVEVPLIIKESIVQMFKCKKTIECNFQIVSRWMEENNVNRKIPLYDLLNAETRKINENQISIFDVMGGK